MVFGCFHSAFVVIPQYFCSEKSASLEKKSMRSRWGCGYAMSLFARCLWTLGCREELCSIYPIPPTVMKRTNIK